MERWRWLPRDLGTAYVMVNIPDYTLRVVKNGKPVGSKISGHVEHTGVCLKLRYIALLSFLPAAAPALGCEQTAVMFITLYRSDDFRKQRQAGGFGRGDLRRFFSSLPPSAIKFEMVRRQAMKSSTF